MITQVKGAVIDKTLATGIQYGDPAVGPTWLAGVNQSQNISITVPANSDAQTAAISAGVNICSKSVIIATPQALLPAGISFYPYKVDNSNYALNFRNNTAAPITLTSVGFRVSIIEHTA